MISNISFVDNLNAPSNVEKLKKYFINDNKIKAIYCFKYKNETNINILLFIDISREVFEKYSQTIKDLLNYTDLISYIFKRNRKKTFISYNNMNDIKYENIDDD